MRAAALLLALAAPAAFGQALELYEADRFGGDRIGIDQPLPDLGQQRFGNRTGSVVVNAGRWELCSERGHRGTCVVFGPGRYDLLPGALAQRVLSVRPVDVVAAAAPPVPVEASPITLYEHINGGGRALSAQGAVPRLTDAGFNDTASSLEVRHGRWQLCAHVDYGPPCRTYGPGRYAIEAPLHDRVSSLRPVYGPDDRPLPPAGGVLLFRDGGWQGRALLLTEASNNLRAQGFNDEASSIEVLAGRWQLCSDADYAGHCQVFGPGRHGLEGPLHDGVSSVRPVASPVMGR